MYESEKTTCFEAVIKAGGYLQYRQNKKVEEHAVNVERIRKVGGRDVWEKMYESEKTSRFDMVLRHGGYMKYREFRRKEELRESREKIRNLVND